ncbi:ABC transporter permease [Paenibacillus sp. FSL H7-0331]|uniref:ABC transporter permease n=1 Tax=Paenibacillus sp. FSL H7-0331 TaxID=1920421 RepID=UPI001C4D738B|nr:ABC transporter permease [Paenibacillus sp. FSL H7-0331]
MFVSSRFIKKVLHFLLALLLLLIINFAIPRLMPGDPFLMLNTEDGSTSVSYTEEQLLLYYAFYGLDKPLPIQFMSYIGGLFHGDWGYSLFYKKAVLPMIMDRIGWTLSMVAAALVISTVIGSILGCLSAWQHRKAMDQSMYVVFVLLAEIPGFIFGILLLFWLSATLDWFPLSGGKSHYQSFSSWVELAADRVHHAVLPVLTLSFSSVGASYLYSRSSMLSVLDKVYLTTARAKGLNPSTLIFRHAFRNALPPIVTRVFLSLGTALGGAILVENVFRYPGIGLFMQEAVMLRDYPVIQGIFLMFSLMVLSMNAFADFVLRKLDPRVSAP